MAVNAASHNPTAEPTGPTISGPPPDVNEETSNILKQVRKDDSLGHQATGKDEVGNDDAQTEFGEGGKPMTARESVSKGAEGPH